MIINTDFGFSVHFEKTSHFTFECDDPERKLTRRELEAVGMMVEAALNTSQEELDAE